MWARIEDGRVAELTELDPVGRYHPSLIWMQCSEEVCVGWELDGEQLVAVGGPSRAEKEEQAWERIKAERDRRTQLGGFQVGEHWFHSDTFSRSQQLGLVMMGDAVPAVQWKTMAGAFVTMTAELASAIFQASAASDMAVFAAAEAHRASMLQSADPQAYDITGNWPQAFGEEA